MSASRFNFLSFPVTALSAMCLISDNGSLDFKKTVISQLEKDRIKSNQVFE